MVPSVLNDLKNGRETPVIFRSDVGMFVPEKFEKALCSSNFLETFLVSMQLGEMRASIGR